MHEKENTMKTKHLLTVVFSGVVLAALIGCGEAQKSSPNSAMSADPASKPAATVALPDTLLLKEAPSGAKDVGVLKKEAKAGDEVVIRGQVAGRVDVFTPGRATVMLADTNLPACSLKPGDKCETPWDLCCETKEILKANTASIQVVGPDGKPLKTDLRGVSGIDHLSVLVVKGTVAAREEQNLVINATGIYVEPPVAKAR